MWETTSQVTEHYLCPLEANVYGIDFTRFRIRDMESNTVLFEIAKPSGQDVQQINDPLDPNAGRWGCKLAPNPKSWPLQKQVKNL